MLLNALNVKNSRGSVLPMPFEDISGGFIVQKIDGLGPVKATLVSSSFANMDGEQYHSSRREARNIVLSLGLEPDHAVLSVKDLRDQLYNFFMPKSEVTLTFHAFDKFATSVLNQILDLDIVGRVESCEPDIFTKDPTLVVSLMCFDPDFYAPIPVLVDGMTVADLTPTMLNYIGTVETGVVFTLRPNRSVPEFTIYHQPPDGTLKMVDVSYPLVAGDVLQISSIIGSKGVKLTRAGVESSIMYAVTPQSAWLELQPGDNSLRVYAGGAPVPYSIEYTNKYGGL